MSKSESLSKSIAGRAITIGAAVTPIHELERAKDRDTLEITLFNSGNLGHIVELHFNGVLTKFTVPANDTKVIGPLTFEGRASDNTEISNKNISLKAPNGTDIQVMGRVFD